MGVAVPSLGAAVATTLNAASACLALLVLTVALAAAADLDVTGNGTADAHSRRRSRSRRRRCRSFALHPNSVRMFLASSALAGVADTLVRGYDLGAFYTSDGVFPAGVYDLVCSTLGDAISTLTAPRC